MHSTHEPSLAKPSMQLPLPLETPQTSPVSDPASLHAADHGNPITTLPNNRYVATGCCSQDCFAAAAVARLSSMVAAAAAQAHHAGIPTPHTPRLMLPDSPQTNPFPMHCSTSRTAHHGQHTLRCWHCHQRSPAHNLGTRSRARTPARLSCCHSCGPAALEPWPVTVRLASSPNTTPLHRRKMATHARSSPVAVAALPRPLQQAPPLGPAHSVVPAPGDQLLQRRQAPRHILPHQERQHSHNQQRQHRAEAAHAAAFAACSAAAGGLVQLQQVRQQWEGENRQHAGQAQ